MDSLPPVKGQFPVEMEAEFRDSGTVVEHRPDAGTGGTPDLRELRYFHSVARTGGFGRAARELNVTQPAVTTQVRKLEHRLGARLLTRHGRGMILTAAGSSLMERLDVIFGLLSAPLEQPAAAESSSGTVSVAMPPEFAPLLVPRLLETCGMRLPAVTLVIQGGSSASLEEGVLDRRTDIAVLQDPPALDDLIADPVVTERLGLVSGARDLSLDGALDGADAIRFRQLTDLKLILPHPRNWVRRLVEDAAFRRGVQLQHVQPADDVTLIKEMVHYGLGHAILPYSVVRDESVRGSLSFRRIEHEPLTTVHAIVSHRDHASSPVVAEMRRTLRGVMTELVENGHWAAASLVRDPAKSQPPQSSARVSGAAMR